MRELILFSLPSIAASLLEPLSGVVDTALVGHLDTVLLAALAVGTTLLSSFTWVFNFLVHASTQAIASAHDDEVGARTRVSLTVALVVGVVTAVALYLFREQLYELVSGGRVASEDIDQYFIPRLIGHPFAIIFMTALSLLRGLSRVRIALVFVFVTTVLNIILSWLFLYQLNVGLSGAAYGTVLANIIGMVASLGCLAVDPRIRRSFSRLPPTSDWFNFGKNSFNLFGRSLAITGSLFVGSRLAANQGATTLAAHQILLQVWLFASFFIDGVAITANIKGADYSKARNQADLKLMIKRVLIIGLWIGAIFALIYFLFGAFIQGIFTSDEQVLKLLAALWPWIALTQITNSLAFVYDGVLFGLGALGGFVWVRRWMLTAAIAVFLPIAFLIGGLEGVWFGLMMMNLFRFATGWWSSNHLLENFVRIK